MDEKQIDSLNSSSSRKQAKTQFKEKVGLSFWKPKFKID